MLGPEWKVISSHTYTPEGTPIGWIADNLIDGGRYNIYFDRNTNTFKYTPVRTDGIGTLLSFIITAIVAVVILFAATNAQSVSSFKDSLGVPRSNAPMAIPFEGR